MRLPVAFLDLRAVGDSITAGAGLAASNLGFVSLLSSAKGMISYNVGIGDTRITDFVESQVYLWDMADRTRTMITPGMNDKWGWIVDGQQTEGRTQYDQSLRASLAFLAIPATKKTLAQAGGTYGGTWTNSSCYGGAVSKKSIANGSTATFSVSGATIILGTTFFFTNGGSLNVTIDGVSQAQISCSGGAYSASPPSGIVRDRAYHPGVRFYTGLTDTIHTVILTAISNGTTQAQVDWIAGIPAVRDGYYTNKVLVGSTLRQVGSTYDAETTYYNSLNVAAVNDLAALGLPIKYSNTGAVYDPNVSGNCTDGIHPTAQGHALIAAQLIADW